MTRHAWRNEGFATLVGVPGHRLMWSCERCGTVAVAVHGGWSLPSPGGLVRFAGGRRAGPVLDDCDAESVRSVMEC